MHDTVINVKDKIARHDAVEVYGARVHNLKNIDVCIPRHSLTVITGMSGSGKSSLAFDTLFAEGQRRYIETFSAYARNFLGGGMERPDVDEIKGLSPVISIEQKTTNRNPRSTVGTVTEVYDFFRLLYARAAEAYSYAGGKKMVKYTEEQIFHLILEKYDGRKIALLAPVVRSRKGHYKELFERLRKKGYLHVRVDGEIREILHGMKLDRYKMHDVEVQIDKLCVASNQSKRIAESLALAMREGEGLVMVLDSEKNEVGHFSRMMMCPDTGISYSDPAPHNFSFNSPHGYCPRCKGLGEVNLPDMDKIIPSREKSIYEGGIEPLGKYKNNLFFWQIEALCEKYDVTIKTPLRDLPEELIEDILYGTDELLTINNKALGQSRYALSFDGVAKYILMQAEESDASATAQKWADQFLKTTTCPDCAGKRLNKEALSYRLAGKDIAEVNAMDIKTLIEWVDSLDEHLLDTQRAISIEILKEIRTRLGFLKDVGLEYLTMNRAAASLSGGESQRIRLATQIGSKLVEVLYILDEPSIGLHQRDNLRLIHSLQDLRDIGNTVVVVEHDQDMMLHADYVIDLGPRAGRHGGEVVFAGSPEEMVQANTLTADYISGRKRIEKSIGRRDGSGKTIKLFGAKGNNLQNIDVIFPLGVFICVTGVSGSGKSTLINKTLFPAISQKLYRSLQDPMPYDRIEGLEHIDKIIAVDQSPIGRTLRSNAATYTGLFTDIRALFVGLPESKARGYKPGRFSFNVKGGRCEVCKGNGYKTIEMNFLPDVFAPCEGCRGKRYNRETLEVRYKGKSIADVLDMTINKAVEFFEHVPHILSKLSVLQEVGLGYIKLGQPSSTLSGGECQRVKLATELSKRDTGNTLYVLDEPTTGLHFEDVRVLLEILNRLIERGNTVIVIEHNLDVIRCADYLIDIGPEGGAGGGQLLYQGKMEDIIECKNSYTAQFVKAELEKGRIDTVHMNSADNI